MLLAALTFVAMSRGRSGASAAHLNDLLAAQPWKARYLICNGLSAVIKLAIYCLEMVICAGHPRSTLQPQLALINQPIPKTTMGEIKAELCKPQKPLFLLSTTPSPVSDCSGLPSRKWWVFFRLNPCSDILAEWALICGKVGAKETAAKMSETSGRSCDDNCSAVLDFVIFDFVRQRWTVLWLERVDCSRRMFFAWRSAWDE